MGKRLVIIEDEADIVELVRYNFQKEGFEVRSFTRGKEGLEDLRRNSADLVILDIMLPDIDGFEVCRRLKAHEQTRSVPVVMLTALSQEENRRKGMECGAVDYMVKPFDPDKLMATIRAHANVHSMKH